MSDERPGTVRLNKFLSQSGVASRRGADILIVAGRVLVDGVVAVPGTKVGPAAVVTVDGTAITAEKHVYLMMNKPAGFVTTVNDEKGRPTVMDLVDVTEHVVPVGRLDAATTGLLLLMNDGELANGLAHPTRGVTKSYRALVRGLPGPTAVRRLERGIELDDGKTQPAVVKIVGTRSGGAELELTIKEGRNRQVRRMCAAIGYPCLALERIAYGPLRLSRLQLGSCRALRPDEVEALREAVAGG